MKKRIGFVGCGNMGSGILAGMLKQHVTRANRVWVYDVDRVKARRLAKRLHVHSAKNNRDLARQVDVIVLAVKPQNLDATIAQLNHGLRRQHVIITILAGVKRQTIAQRLKYRVQIARAMPNLAATVGAAITALTGSAPGLRIAEEIFASCGTTLRLPEKHFDAVTAVSGSGPAYFFLLMEQLITAARSFGLSPRAARSLAIETARGAALLAQVSPYTPGTLREMVTSKGGTTAAALRVMFRRKLPEIVMQAVRQARKRARALGR